MTLIGDFIWFVWNPSRALVLLAVLAATAGGGFYAGHHWAAGDCATKEIKTVKAVIKTANTITTMTQAVTGKYEADREERRQSEQRNHEESRANVQKNLPTYSQCGLDADGVRLWNERNASADAGAGEPDAIVPLLAAHLGWHAAEPDPQPRNDHQPVSGLPEAAERAGQLDPAEGAAD